MAVGVFSVLCLRHNLSALEGIVCADGKEGKESASLACAAASRAKIARLSCDIPLAPHSLIVIPKVYLTPSVGGSRSSIVHNRKECGGKDWQSVKRVDAEANEGA